MATNPLNATSSTAVKGTPERVALIQHCAGADVAQNLQTVSELVAQAAAQGAATICLPEAFAFIGPNARKTEILEPLDSNAPTPILDLCRELARTHGCHLLLGGFHERVEPVQTGMPAAANTTVHLDPEGRIKARYRKIHMFDVDLADGTRLAESNNTQAGDRAVVSDCPLGTLGLTICYDLRFPALYQRLVTMGAIAIAVPSAFTQTTGAAHWHALLRARAIETQCYVLAAAQYGQHNAKRRSYGHSLVVDPWGTIVAEGPADADAVVVATIDPAEVDRVRAQMPVRSHHRPFD